MRAKCRRLAAEHGLHLVIVDYIQLMQGRGRFENRTLELASISRSLKGLAKELSVPIVVLSQLSRAPESRSDHRPQLSDLRESGALEQDADVVVFIYREDLYADKSQPPTDAPGRRRAHHRQAAQRPDRRREARVHPRVHAVREPRRRATRDARMPDARIAASSIAACVRIRHLGSRDDSSDRRARRSRRAQVELPRIAEHLARERPIARRASSPSSRRTRTATARRRWRARSRMPAPICWRAPTSRKASRCARPACAPRSSSSARSASAISTACSTAASRRRSPRPAPRARCRRRPRATSSALRYHLKIDTGMNRLGFRYDNLRRTLPELLASPNLELDAVYTHFATADDPESPLFDEQRVRFERALAEIEALGGAAARIGTRRTARRSCATRASGTTACGPGCCSTASCRRRSRRRSPLDAGDVARAAASSR